MDFQTLQKMSDCMGWLAAWLARGLVIVIGVGSLFIAITLHLQQMLQDPGQTLHVQAFEVNYQDMRQATSSLPRKKDGNWDGTLAGASFGYAYGSSIPLIGPMVGPLLGAVLGYRLDDQIK